MGVHNVKVDIINGDAKDIDTDLLVLKNSRGSDGVGVEVANALQINSLLTWPDLPDLGESAVYDGGNALKAQNVLYIGVKPIPDFGYQDIRRFARRSLEIAARKVKRTEHVTLTLHGPGYGLDEREAFESELAGLMEAVQEGKAPQELKRITFVEINPKRAERLKDILSDFLSGNIIERDKSTPEQARSVGYDSEGKPHVFVAMPFAEEFEDVYYLGIKEAVNSAGFLCERIDNQSFTGSIEEQIQNRIQSASLVIADLTNSNPNVYLEVGYAWGENVPTLLLTQSTDDLKFDVQHHKSITYNRNGIRELKDDLTETLSDLDLPHDSYNSSY